MKYSIIFFYLLLNLVSAQADLGQWDHPAQLITRDSFLKKGYIRVIADDRYPWGFQSRILFMDEEQWNNLVEEPTESEFTEYRPADLQEYRITDVNITFLGRTFSDKSSIGMNMIPKRYFMRLIEDGKVKLFYYYDVPAAYYVSLTEELAELDIAEVNLYVLIQIGNEKLKKISEIDIQQMISDCPKVLEDYKAGKYGVEPSGNEKSKGIIKFLKKENNHNPWKDFIAPVIRDYNLCAIKK